MLRKKTRLQKARQRLKKRWFFERRSLPERAVDALEEFLKVGR
jgi:hypothetical protein